MSIINRLHFGNQKKSGNLRKERLDNIILSQKQTLKGFLVMGHIEIFSFRRVLSISCVLPSSMY